MRTVYGTSEVDIMVDDYKRGDTTVKIKSEYKGKLDFVEVDGITGEITIHITKNTNELHFDENGDHIKDDKDKDVVIIKR